MAAAGVGGDGQKRIAEVRIEHRAGGEVDAVLPAQGALRVVALARVFRAEEQRVDGLITLDIQQAQGLPGLDFEQVRLAGRNQVAEAGGFRMQAAFYEGHVGNLLRCRVVRCCGSRGRSPDAKCGKAR